MSPALAGAIALAAIGASYFFCVRPGLRGRCTRGGTDAGSGTRPGADIDRQLAQLREELRVLRAQELLDTDQLPHPHLPPGNS